MLKLSRKTWFGLGLLGLNVAAISLPFTADAETTNTDVNLSIGSVITSYSSGPTVTLGAITPDSTGRQSIASDTVSAATNNATGLTITLEDAGGSTAMVSGSDSIPASAGTPDSPIALANNTWGWRIDDLVAPADFGSGPTGTLSNAVPSSLTFAGIPANGAPYTIHTTAANGSTSATVWYSARVDNTQPTGSYTGTVTYTITTN